MALNSDFAQCASTYGFYANNMLLKQFMYPQSNGQFKQSEINSINKISFPVELSGKSIAIVQSKPN